VHTEQWAVLQPTAHMPVNASSWYPVEHCWQALVLWQNWHLGSKHLAEQSPPLYA